jgi:hypothetical protein
MCSGTAKHRLAGGFVLLYVAIAIAVIGGTAATLAVYSSSANTSEVQLIQTMNARYLAESGLYYARGLIASYASQSKTIDETITALNQNSGRVALDGYGSFTVTATKSGASDIVLSVKGVTKAGLAELQLPSDVSVTYTPASTATEASTTPALKGTYSGSSAYIAGTYTGSVTTQSATLTGGTTVGGSVTYLGTSSCLTITGGVTVGTKGSDTYVCSDSCLVLDGGSTINGNVYSQGSVTLASTTMNGDVYSGGDVTITSGTPTVNGNIYLTGTFSKPAWYTYKGTVTKISAAPEQCATYTLPDHEIVSASSVLKLNGGKYTFFGKSDLADKSNAYTGITSSGWPSVCLDLTTGPYINFFINGNVNFSGNLYVRTSTSNSCFTSATQVYSTGFAGSAAASGVYMDATGTVTFGGGTSWFGTVFAGGDIKPGSGGAYIGAFYTSQSFNPSQAWISSLFVMSDYVSTYWP